MEPSQKLTREKHLDHLVRVVPLLCLAYGVQSFMLLSYARGGGTGALLAWLGASLAVSVVALVTYDLKQEVHWNAEGFSYRFPWSPRGETILRTDIQDVQVIGEPEEFQTVIVKFTHRRPVTFYFVDNGHDFKAAMLKQSTVKIAA